jgi:hypothetical protein
MGHLALVTGGARRLGRAIALRLADSGADVVIHYRSSAADADETAREACERGVRAWAVGFDQSDPLSIKRGLSEIRALCGRAPDVLVNSASVFEWDDLSTLSATGLQRHFETNLFGPLLLTQALVAGATDETRGAIINLLDQKLFAPNPDHLSYTLSKYALAGATEVLARQLAPRFRVGAVAPGYTLPGPGDSNERFDQLHDRNPLRRGPLASDIADAVAFLVASKAMTGQTLIVDGGARFLAAGRDFAFENPAV